MTFDPDADAAYIYLQPADVLQPSVAETRMADVELVGSSIHLDFNTERQLVGIEILGAARLLHSAVLDELAS